MATERVNMNDDNDNEYGTMNIKIMTFNVKRDRTGDSLANPRTVEALHSDEAKRRVTSEVARNVHWDSRVSRIAKAIVSNDPDVVVINELRKLDTSNHSTLFAQEGMDQYCMVQTPTNNDKYTFINAILWKPTKLTYTRAARGHDKIPQLSKNNRYVTARFLPVYNGDTLKFANGLTVVGVHFGLPEDQKWTEIATIRSLANDVGGDSLVVCGDMNVFADKDGKKMLLELQETFENHVQSVCCHGHVEYRARFSQSGKQATCSFVPVECDFMYARSTGDILLDNILSLKNDEKLSNRQTIVETRTFHDDECDELACLANGDHEPTCAHNLPSDHLPVFTTFTWKYDN